MDDRIQAWLMEKKALEAVKDYDTAYEDEARCSLLEEAQRIFESLLKN